MDIPNEQAEAALRYSRLVIQVDGRDALPVRAIPYVTGWTLSPDAVAKHFSRENHGIRMLEKTDTFHRDGSRTIPMLPKEWDQYVADIDALERRLDAEFVDEAIAYAVWREKSAQLLPAGVFVWFDDFEKDWARDMSPKRRSRIDERPGDRELSLSPKLEPRTLDMVLAGFEFASRPPVLSHSDQDIHAALVEQIANGRLIDWTYWVQRMPTLSAAEAARLMAALEPDLYDGMGTRPRRDYDPTRDWARVKAAERLADAEGISRQSPTQWYEWAEKHALPMHKGFSLAVRGRYLLENEQAVLAGLPSMEARRWIDAEPAANNKRLVVVDFAGHLSSASMFFPDFFVEVMERLTRWRRGIYTLAEAAQVIADSAGLDARSFAFQMDKAVQSGALNVRLNGVLIPPVHLPPGNHWHRELFETDVNAWLDTVGSGQTLTYPYAPGPSVTTEQGREKLDGSSLTQANSVIVHSTRGARRDILSPLVEEAMAAVRSPGDVAAVWNQMTALAEKKTSPLLGTTEEGIQYLRDGEAHYLTRDALAKRVRRMLSAAKTRQ